MSRRELSLWLLVSVAAALAAAWLIENRHRQLLREEWIGFLNGWEERKP